MILVDMLGLTVTIPEQSTLSVVAFCNTPGTKPEPLGPTNPDGCGFLAAELVRLLLSGTVFNMTVAFERGDPLGLELPPRFRLRMVVSWPKGVRLPVPPADEGRLLKVRSDVERPLG